MDQSYHSLLSLVMAIIFPQPHYTQRALLMFPGLGDEIYYSFLSLSHYSLMLSVFTTAHDISSCQQGKILIKRPSYIRKDLYYANHFQ